MSELFGLALAQIRLQERGRGVEDRDFIPFHDLPGERGIQRIGKISHAAPGGDRDPEAGVHAEGVEQGQIAQDHIAYRIECQNIDHGVHVRIHIVVTQHDPFRVAGGSAGEQYQRGSVHILPGDRRDQVHQFFRGEEGGTQREDRPFQAGDRRFQIFQIQDLRSFRQVIFLCESAGGDDLADLSGPEGGCQHIPGRGVVQGAGHPVGVKGGENGKDAIRAVGQEDPGVFVFCGQFFPERPAQKQGAQEGGKGGVRRAVAVPHQDPVSFPFGIESQPDMQGILRRTGVFRSRFRRQFRDLLPDGKGGCPGGHGLADGDGRPVAGPQGQHVPLCAAVVGKITAPHVPDIDRDHRYIRHVRRQHFQESAAEFTQQTVPGGRTFRIDADDVARPQCSMDLLKHLHKARPVGRQGDEVGQTPHHPQQTALFCQPFVQQETDPPGGAGADEDVVRIGNMVGDQQRRTLCRDVLRAGDLQFVDRIAQRDDEETQSKIRQRPHGEESDQKCHKPQQQEQRVSGDRVCRVRLITDRAVQRPEQDPAEQRGKSERERLMDRQGHAPGFRFQPLLEIGPQRDHKKSAADPGEEQEDRSPQGKDPGQCGEGFQMQGERQHGTGKLDSEEQGKRHAQRPERYQTRLDLFCGKSAGEQTARRKADHRCGLKQTGGKEVAVPAGPFVLKQNQQQGQDRADGEEEIFSQRRQQFGGAVPQIPQTGKDLPEKTLFNGHGDGETHLERGIKSQQGQARTGEQHGEGIQHQRCCSDPGKQGNVGPDPHGPVGAGKILFGECFRQDAIECRNRQCPD